MPKTLLLADDSVTIQKVVGITFANEDVELVTVDNGADALVRAMELKPDLIMADIAMPGMGGYELCAAIRRDPELAGIPLLLLTGTFETYDEEKARAVGASGHIAKPFEAQALIGQFYALTDQERTRVVDPHSLTAIPQPEALAATAIPQPEALAATAIPQPEAPATTAIPQPEAPATTAIPQPEAPATTAIPQPEAPATTAIPQPEAPATTAIPQPEAPAVTAIPQPAVAQMTPAEPLIDAEPLPAEFLPNEALSGEPLAAQPAAHAAPIAQNPNWVEENPNLLTDLPNTDFNAPSALPHAHAGATPAIQPLVEDPNAVPSLSGLPTPDSEEFSFEDLEFGDAPTTNTDTGVFGAASESPAPAVDYSETTFLDPQTSLSPLPPVAPMQEAPAWQPDPLADTIPEDPFANTNDDSGSSDLPLLHRSAAFAPARPEDDTAVEGARAGQPIAEAVPWPDPEPAPSTAPADFAPVQMSTDAALLEAEPMFSPIADTDTVPVPALPTPVEPLHAEPLAEEPLETEPWETEPLEAEPLDAMPLDTQPLEGGPLMIEPELEFDTEQDIAAGQRSPEGSFEAAAARLEADTALPSTEDLFAPEPAPEGNLNPLPQGIHLDPADVRNAIEKVAWEAFGAVQEQLMREVTARTEAAIWEIVPQLAERLVREEIARLKADVDE